MERFLIVLVIFMGSVSNYASFDTKAKVPLGKDDSVSKNLVEYGSYLLASSFKGTDTRTVKTDNYYDNVKDGKPETVWIPMDKEAPHWLEVHWRYPLKINKFSYQGRGIKTGVLSAWIDGEWREVAKFSGKNTSIYFPLQTTKRLRLDITTTTPIFEIAEIEAYGPKQAVPPQTVPVAGSNLTGEEFTISDISISPAKAKEKVKISFRVSAEKTLQKNYYFLIDIKEKLPFSAWKGDLEVAAGIGTSAIQSTEWEAGKKYSVSVEIYLPDYTPSGKTNIEILAMSMDGKKTAKLSQYTLGTINVLSENIKSDLEEFPQAKLAFNNGQFGFQIGQKFKLPFFMRYMNPTTLKGFYDTRKNGIDIQYFFLYNRCIGGTRRQDYFEHLDKNIINLLKLRPNCYVMIGVDLRTHPNWQKANPDELMLDAFGNKPCDIKNETGIVSFGSEKYENDCRKLLADLMDFIASKPYAGRVIGWHPMICSQLDSFIGGISGNKDKGRSQISIGDFHTGAIRKYREWLKKKYHNSIAELRKSWKDDKATFETAKPVIKELVQKGAEGGMFRDPFVCRPAYDYLEFFPSLLGSFNRRIAKFIKEKTDNKALVMIHYGAVTMNLRNAQPSGARNHVNNFDLAEMLKDPNIDMYVYAPNYHTRHSGQPYVVWPPVDSMTIHDRIFLADNDQRTFTAGTLYHGRHRGVKETCAVMMRDMSWHLLKNSGAWFSDMSRGGTYTWSAKRHPWFAHPATAEAMKDVVDVFRKGLKRKHVSSSEIAVFISLSTPHYEDIYRASPLYFNLIYHMLFKNINMLGAPYDMYLMSDLDNPKLKKDYKLYIFLNPFLMNKKERTAINNLKGDGKTLLWFYAPGFIDKNRGLITDGIKEVTGINVRKKAGKEKPQMVITGTSHAIIENIHGKSIVTKGYGDNFWGKRHPDVYGPIFYVDDPEVEILGRYPDEKAAFAVRKFKNWNSIYCAVPYLSSNVLRNIAAFAGVNIYCREDVVMAGDNRFLMFNNGCRESKTITIFLPEKKKVIDAISGEVVSFGKREFQLKMKAPQTRILSLMPSTEKE